MERPSARPTDIDEDEVPSRTIRLQVNGVARRVTVEDRQLLVDVLRERLHLTGTRVGCYNGDCGACTVRVDGRITKSCLVLAASTDRCEIQTIEGLSPDGRLGPVQQAFWDCDAFQCGFCVAGHLFAIDDLLESNADPSEEEVRHAVSGNLCRCTGYHNIVKAAQTAARRSTTASPQDDHGPRT
jgi:aerobic-type carbon monoxide dehydrogenase small subunit (CoxS/CutS family)